MHRPTGEYAKYQFVVLSQGMPHNVEVVEYRQEPFILPSLFAPYLSLLTDYWLAENPALRDFPSIVHLEKVLAGNGRIWLWYQPTSYFQFLFSNYSLDIPLPDGHTLRRLYEQGLCGKFGPTQHDFTGRMPSPSLRTEYGFPVFGNSLGITISVITADKEFIVTKRSQQVARDKGKWSCAVGTQVKRHKPHFLNPAGVPLPELSAMQGLKDELGEEVAKSCGELRCNGLVFREDFMHCDLLYEVTSSLEAKELLLKWRDTFVGHRKEFETVSSLDINKPEPLLNHLRHEDWSPENAAGALHSLAARFYKVVQEACGLEFDWEYL